MNKFNVNNISNWTFEIEEISAGVYKVRGIDKNGRSVEITGIDPDAILKQCQQSAAEIDLSAKKKP